MTVNKNIIQLCIVILWIKLSIYKKVMKNLNFRISKSNCIHNLIFSKRRIIKLYQNQIIQKGPSIVWRKLCILKINLMKIFNSILRIQNTNSLILGGISQWLMLKRNRMNKLTKLAVWKNYFILFLIIIKKLIKENTKILHKLVNNRCNDNLSWKWVLNIMMIKLDPRY